MAATGTFVDAAAESCRPALLDRSQDLQMPAGDPLSAAFYELLSRGADDIGHLKGWPLHLRARGWFGFGCTA